MNPTTRDLVANRCSQAFKTVMVAADLADAANLCGEANDLRDIAWELHRVQEALTLRTARPRRPGQLLGSHPTASQFRSL